jgi:hypothetical protein
VVVIADGERGGVGDAVQEGLDVGEVAVAAEPERIAGVVGFDAGQEAQGQSRVGSAAWE